MIFSRDVPKIIRLIVTYRLMMVIAKYFIKNFKCSVKSLFSMGLFAISYKDELIFIIFMHWSLHFESVSRHHRLCLKK